MMRLDSLLVARGLVDSRARAKAAIKAGGVTIDGEVVTNASRGFDDGAVISVIEAHDWVGRGALKLDHALTLWPVEVAGRVVLDVGASTGGFTEVCLKRGAVKVFAVDVGFGQLHPRVAADPRVVDLERTDARALDPTTIPSPPGLIVCDASFIGLAKVLPVALDLAEAGADLVALVKPQFEGEGPSSVGKKGIVRDPEAHVTAVEGVSAWLASVGWTARATTQSPIAGGDGNVEFLIWATKT